MELKTKDNTPEENDDVVIAITKLLVWTPEEKSWWRCKSKKQSTLILDKVSGYVKRGEFAAVIGPSGAGKTTFLVSLAGKCTLPSEGMVTVNSVNVKDVQYTVEIVPQFDVFIDSLSVIEHLIFMTEMKLGSYKTPSNRSALSMLIRELKLEAHQETPIFALSGGERRLLSLATSLLSNPEILICDEPTTGLDSYNAAVVIDVLKKISTYINNTVNKQKLRYKFLYNTLTSINLHFCPISIDLRCPVNYNPAEFYIRAVSNNRQLGKIQKYYEDRLDYVEPSLSEVSSRRSLSQRNWFKQVHLLLWRLSLTLKREVKNHLLQLFLSVMVSALILGTCYSGISGTTQRGVQDIRGFLWLITSEVSFSLSYSALYVFEFEMSLFKREVGIYKCSAYLVSRFLSFIPRCILWPATLVTLATFTVNLPNHLITSLEIMTALTVSAIGAMSYGLGMSALFTSTGIMGDVIPCADIPLLLMSGAFHNIPSMPVWLYPVKYVSHFYYAMDAVSNVYWRQIDHIDCPLNETSLCVKDGPSVLIANGYSTNFILQDGVGLLFLTLLWALLGYCGLKREERKGYAY
ncbi:hypothetical protein K1T71_002111 [Dendrolimus kikuchii]|uniref:Uncharacterized protein n=1 Tax=Dendrolimus kikuchii TaxID=765133 RepID=A0ACC1DGK2_9NEOP|nr:hypothetical protein K1T71_002111 [Dendrolimus kikuchii]